MINNLELANTYTQLVIHVILVVKYRKKLILPAWEENLHKYITGIIKQKGQKLFAINGTSDHVHILIGIKPDCMLSDLIREVKKSTNAFINDQRLTKDHFYWQKGFAAFSKDRKNLDSIIAYIQNQKAHHGVVTIEEEYVKILKQEDVQFEDRYLFD